MTKETVQFLASDSTKYHNVNEFNCASCKTFDDLIDYVNRNQINGGEGLIKGIEKIATVELIPITDKNGIVTLSQARSFIEKIKKIIDDRILSGRKKYRQSLLAYPSYQKQMKKIENEALSIDYTEAPPNKIVGRSASKPDTDMRLKFLGDIDWPNWLALVIGTLNTILIIVLWAKGSKSATKGEAKSDLKDNDLMRFDNMNIRNFTENHAKSVSDDLNIDSDITQLRRQVEILSNKYDKISESFASLSADKMQFPNHLETATKSNNAQIDVSNSERLPQTELSLYPMSLYSRTVDMPGGFSVAGLTNAPTRPMVFILSLTSRETATFMVSDDPNAQHLALSDPFSYLSEACSYTSHLGNNSRIINQTPGELRLVANKWEIVKKAEINFAA